MSGLIWQLDRLFKALAVGGGMVLMGIVLITMVNVTGFSANVIVRPFGGSVPGLPGYEDAVGLLVGLAALALFPWCQRIGGHIAVDLFLERAPEAVQRGVAIGSAGLMAMLAFWLAWMMGEGALQALADGQLSPVLAWPVWPFMAMGSVLVLLWGVAALVTMVAGYVSPAGEA